MPLCPDCVADDVTPPDSDAREATRWVYCSDPTCSERRLHLAHQPAIIVPVVISRDLAQRILAALERDIWTELAAELREHIKC